ncbi:uncharacterized protein LOC119941760 isoform X2 [Tachyglossus aculeatus]|nr:uncharacterized protein LOC119941760 isoform X2 [Tachyglossus aculeatus]XP_038618172.1 uncharacterized protein LOC119941760 isoform X2 [Tachyglossus aculeatus]
MAKAAPLTVLLLCSLPLAFPEPSAPSPLPGPASPSSLPATPEPPGPDSLLINEINADNPGQDKAEFVELWHRGGGRVSLDGYCLVFYDGHKLTAYRALPLTGLATDGAGFFVAGSPGLQPPPALLLPAGTIQNGPDAIALHRGGPACREGQPVTSRGLVDAWVHASRRERRPEELLRLLTPGREPLLEDAAFHAGDESLERCPGPAGGWTVQVAEPSPGRANPCIPYAQLNRSAFLLSEVLPPADGAPGFVELQGPPLGPLRDTVLVLLDGRTGSVASSLNLSGLSTNAHGFFVLRTDQRLPDDPGPLLLAPGPAAVALYRGEGQGLEPGKPPPSAGLLDALVYGPEGTVPAALLEALTPGRPALATPGPPLAESGAALAVSLSRCSCCSISRDSTLFALGSPTPDLPNDCPSRRYSLQLAFCLRPCPDSDCSAWLKEESALKVELAGRLEAECHCGVTAVYLKDWTLKCQGPKLAASALLVARSPEQQRSLDSALRRVLASPEPWWAGTDRNATLVSPCSLEPSPVPELLINEVNADSPGVDEDGEFVELWSPAGPRALDGFWLVLYNGRDGRVYRALDLRGRRTDAAGLFLVGSARLGPGLALPPSSLQNGADAVALFRGPPGAFKKGSLVTARGLQDALVSSAWPGERAQRLLDVLTPGQELRLEKGPDQSPGDLSLSRCHSVQPRSQASFQLTRVTPLSENDCPPLVTSSPPLVTSSPPLVAPSASGPPAPVVISELSSAPFVELWGTPGARVDGLVLALLGPDGIVRASLPLRGLVRTHGLFLVAPKEGRPSPDQPWPGSALLSGSGALAVYDSRLARVAVGQTRPRAGLLDAVVFGREAGAEPGPLTLLGPTHFLASDRESLWSLSRCSPPGHDALAFASSDPTPGSVNSCPTRLFALALDLCLPAPNCSAEAQPSALTVTAAQRALVNAVNRNCSCGISEFYLQETHFSCSAAALRVSGRLWARSPEQQVRVSGWYTHLPAQLPPDGAASAGPACVALGAKTAPSRASLRAWETSLIVLGSLLILALLGALCYLQRRRPEPYSHIELTDREQIKSDF